MPGKKSEYRIGEKIKVYGATVKCIAPHYLEARYVEVDPEPSAKDALNLIEAMLTLANHKPFVVIHDWRNTYMQVTAEVNKTFVQHKEFQEKRIAAAYIVNSLPTRMFFKVNTRAYKLEERIRVFSDEAEAKEWLNGKLKSIN